MLMVGVCMLMVVPSRRGSRRVKDKNHRLLMGQYSLTDLAVRYAHGLGKVIVVADDYQNVLAKTLPYPKWGQEKDVDVDSSIDVWGYAAQHSGVNRGLTALIEPSSYRLTGPEKLREAIASWDGRTTVAVRMAHRYGMKAHVLVPTGEFYLASVMSVLDGTAFDGDLRYVFSDAINIDTEVEYERACEIEKGRATEVLSVREL